MEILREIDEYIAAKHPKDTFFEFYPFSNEKIKAYLPMFDLEGKSLLTVGSSSDQAICASYAGADDITLIDICPLTRYYHHFKVAALLQLDREEFLKFMSKWQPNTGYNYEVYNMDSFHRIKHRLKAMDYDSYQVWDYLLRKYNSLDLNWVIRTDILSRDEVEEYMPYLNSDEDYQRAQKRIENTNVRIINGDLSKTKFDRKYDNIWLSNVIDYLEDEEVIKLMRKVEKSLNPKGKALVEYYIADFRKREIPKESFKKGILEERNIPRRDGTKSCSSVVVYQKTR